MTSVLIGASKPEQILDNIGIIGHTSFSKEELEKIQTMADVINLAEENDFEELYLSYMDF